MRIWRINLSCDYMKKKSVTELKDEKAQLSIRSKAIIDGAKAEKRMFNEEENEELRDIQSRMAEINVEIEEVIEENRQEPTKKINKKLEKFSLRKAILAQMSGKAQGAADDLEGVKVAVHIDVAVILKDEKL